MDRVSAEHAMSPYISLNDSVLMITIVQPAAAISSLPWQLLVFLRRTWSVPADD